MMPEVAGATDISPVTSRLHVWPSPTTISKGTHRNLSAKKSVRIGLVPVSFPCSASMV